MLGSPEQGRDMMPRPAASLNDDDVFLLRAAGGLRIAASSSPASTR